MCRSGEYFINSGVVGSRMFIARTSVGWLPPIVLMPALEKPTADNNSVSSACALFGDRRAGGGEVVQDRHDVVCRIRIRLRRLTEQLPVLPDGFHPRVHREQHVVRVGDRLPDASPLPRTDSATAERIEFSLAGSMACTTACRFWKTVLTSTVTLRECSTAPGFEPVGAGVRRNDQIDVLGAERGARLDLRLDIARQVREWAGVDLQAQLRNAPAAPVSAADIGDFADLDAAQLYLRAVLHHQTCPVGHQGQRDVAAQRAGEQHRGQRADRDDRRQATPAPTRSGRSSRVGMSWSIGRYPDRWKLPDCPYTDSVMVNRMKTPAVIDMRTARPTASPTPAGPPVTV